MNQSVTSFSDEAHPIIFGEVLFDSFPDESTVLGGAPFNVAWHLQGFGLQPLLISRVGDDPLGQHITQTMTAWGMDTAGIQLDDQYPTGTVQVSLANGQPHFSIVPDQAYDYIELDTAQELLQNTKISLLYHGSLALRNSISRDALMALRSQKYSVPTFIDVNLREPWWSRESITQVLKGATWVKLNDVELAELSQHESAKGEAWLQAAQTMLKRYGLQLLIFTQGDQGASVISTGDVLHGAPHPVNKLVDTVGAGDAFSAATLLGLLLGWPLTHTLQCALEFGSLLCTQRGATIQDAELYQSLLDKWEQIDA